MLMQRRQEGLEKLVHELCVCACGGEWLGSSSSASYRVLYFVVSPITINFAKSGKDVCYLYFLQMDVWHAPHVNVG